MLFFVEDLTISSWTFVLKLLEIGARMEAEDKHREQVERTDDEFADISFEELLAQEKKDAFWLVSILIFQPLFRFSRLMLTLRFFYMQAEEWQKSILLNFRTTFLLTTLLFHF